MRPSGCSVRDSQPVHRYTYECLLADSLAADGDVYSRTNTRT